MNTTTATESPSAPSTTPPRPGRTICQVLHSLRTGGAEVLADRLARSLSGAHRFVFACLDELGSLGEDLRRDGYTIEVLGRRDGLDWGCARRLARFLERERADLVHAHQYTPFFYSALARFPGRRPPILFTEHGRSFPDFRRPKRVVANRLLLGPRDRVIGVGEAVRRALIENEGLPAGRVEVVYNGVDLDAFAGGDRAAARRAIGLGDGDLAVFFVARLDPVKDHATAIRAVARVAQRLPAIRLVVVGEGPEEANIRRLVGELRLEANVLLLGLRGDVARLLPAADVGILTSVSEGIPLALIEAMAAGLPVVATRAGGNPEVVDDGVTGLLASPGDDAALAAHIVGLLGDPATRTRMGESGRLRANSQFSLTCMTKSYNYQYLTI